MNNAGIAPVSRAERHPLDRWQQALEINLTAVFLCCQKVGPQLGRKCLSNYRWTVGGKLCLLLKQYGLVVAWDCATANVADNTFQWLIRQFEERMLVLSDPAFHAAQGDPTNLKLCQRGEWPERMLVEPVLSMLTVVCHFKRVMHRVWVSFQARLAFTMAAVNVLVHWHGLRPNAYGFVPLSMAEFGLKNTNIVV